LNDFSLENMEQEEEREIKKSERDKEWEK